MKVRFFELAKKISFKSPSRYKLGSVIVNKNKVVSVGFNNMAKSHPKMPGTYKFLHAEVHSLLGCNYNETKGSTLYVYRETLNGDLAQARPCSNCYQAILASGIHEICYTTPEGYKKEVVK